MSRPPRKRRPEKPPPRTRSPMPAKPRPPLEEVGAGVAKEEKG